MDRAPTILFQPPNHIGLGHTNRLTSIALALRQLEPTARVAFMLDGAGTHRLLDTATLPYVILPHFSDDATWQLWSPSEREALSFALSVAALDRVQPDMVVFDCFPNVPLLSAVLSMSVPFAVCARKTTDDASYFRNMKPYEAALSLLLIPHEPGSVAVPPELASRTHYVGTIQRPVTSGDRSQTAVPVPPIVITGGGGGHPQTVDFYNLAVDAFAICRRDRPALEGLLVTGPLFAEWKRLRLTGGLRLVPFEPHLAQLLSNTSLILSQAGYNTIVELKALPVQCICVPAPRWFDDQAERAQQIAAASSTFHVFSGTDPHELAALMAVCLDAPPATARTVVRQQGAARAAALILEHSQRAR